MIKGTRVRIIGTRNVQGTVVIGDSQIVMVQLDQHGRMYQYHIDQLKVIK